MAFQRSVDGLDPLRPERIGSVAGKHDQRRDARSQVVALGTLACPCCDAPIALGPEALRPTAPLACPFCAQAAPLRAFLSLAGPPRPARVEVRVVPSAGR